LASRVLKTQGNAVTRYSNLFSTASICGSQRTKYINALVEENGPGKLYQVKEGSGLMVDYKSIEIDTALLLETLRNMQSYRRLTPNDSSTSKLNPEVPAFVMGVADGRIK
jgi:serine kinase of HPr protein (carbohydrate metabolism regulator)